MADKLDSISFLDLATYDIEALEYARNAIAKEINRRQGGEYKKLQKQFARLAGAMGYALVNQETGNPPVKRRRRRASSADKQEE